MFKLESYITPILLSYVDKYINNFRPEDSQVSLWGGDASFHNLDLRLEVLEQELQLPFSFMSGHIHELQIHVPWTKLASEPITITINTIECILKLRGDSSQGSDSASQANVVTNTTRDSRRKTSKKQDVVAPSGYVQSLVNKIVSNITIFCNNLILKYVEEDIVLSVNVKTVTLQSANELWQPTFTEISPLLRKLISLADLTICLDKRNASGKIEMYQEPLLYRCSLDIHLLRSYHSATAKRASVTRVDIHCTRMDFSVTEQQIPMLMRLALLGLALHGRELVSQQSSSVNPLDDAVPLPTTDDDDELPNESWAGWAWSFIPSILPYYFEEDWNSDQQVAYSGHTYHTGFYVKRASVILKITETTSDRSYYGPRKVKFIPFLTVQLQGCFMEFIMQGVGWLNAQLGVSRASVQPSGDCFCGVKDVLSCSVDGKDNDQEVVYFTAGSEQVNYIAKSLFDPESQENKGQRRMYNASWDYHLSTVTEDLLLQRNPAIAVDYLYMLEVPDDLSSEPLSDLISNLEYSNLPEKSICRIVVGPTAVKLCSGLFHRLQMVHHYAKVYDYAPYSTPKSETNPDNLQVPTLEEFKLLEQNIPKQVFQLTLFKPVIHVILADHPAFDPLVLHAPRKHRNKLTQIQPLARHIRHLPKVTLECDCLDAKVVKPMYPRRLVSMTCRHPAPPQHVFHSCHFHTNVKLLGVNSQLVLGPGKQTTFLMPSNVTFTKQNLVLPNYWNNVDIPHVDQAVKADSLTVTCTKAKLMVIVNVIQSQFNPTSAVDVIQNSTLLTDAEKHIGVEYLELCVEAVTYRRVVTPGTEAFSVIVGSVKAFVLEFPLKHSMPDMLAESQQALVLSGPDNSGPLDTADVNAVQDPLLNLTMQFTKSPDSQDHPPVIIFNLREVRACVDPMMWEWLRYAPTRISVRYDTSYSDTMTSNGSTIHRRNRRLSSESTIGPEANVARRVPTPQESVHSSSDRDQLLAQTVPPLSPVPHSRITQSESEKQTSVPHLQDKETIWRRSNLLHWFPVWRGLVLSGDMAQCVVYLPTSSLSAVGSHSIEDALAHCLQNKTTAAPEVLVITFPFLTLRSTTRKQDLHQYTSRLPVKLPDIIWTKSKVSFPWSLAVSDMSCYTLQNGSKLHFLKPVSANATVGISTKYQNDESTLTSLGFCVHVDTTPVKISVSQEQVNLMAGVLVGLLEFSSSLQFFTFSYSDVVSTPVVDPPMPTSPTLFPESSGSRESPSTPFKTQESIEQNELIEQSETVKMTVFMQSTLARLTVSMYAESPSPSKDDLKLVIDMEDIMNSLDFQQVYLKVKCKVALANIKHYIRKKGSVWTPGPHVGLVMRGHEDVATSLALHRELDDGGGFLSLTFTRAKCRNVHSRWGTRKQTTLLANSNSDSCQGSVVDKASARYISEIVVKLQAVDFVFSASTLGNFLVVLYPILMLPKSRETRKTTSSVPNWKLLINNNTLPLLYLDTHSIRVILPAAELTNMDELHDVCLLQVDAITLTPQADNPLGRVVLRNDIYHMAEQSRMLCVPGSDVEDRQYQVDITGFSINTGMWKELHSCLGLTSSQPTPALHTMSENPALEWNNLVLGRESITPRMSLLPVISRLNLCVIAAPAIVYRGDILVCGHSLEVNAVTDIEISVSTGQLLLASALATEILSLFKPLLMESTLKATLSDVIPDATNKSFSAVSVENKTIMNDSSRYVDSGVDCAEASSASFVAATGKMSFKVDSLHIEEEEGNSAAQHSHQNILFRQVVSDSPFTEAVSKYSVSSRQGGKWNEHQNVPLEVLLTAGKISCVLYELKDGPSNELHSLSSRLKQKQAFYSHNKDDSIEDAGYEAGSEEGSVEDLLPLRKQVQPLVYVLLAQPHAFLSILPFTKKIQMSCFDLSIRMSEPDFVIPRRIPRRDDFSSTLLETKNGDPHPNTGIPPAFLTAKWSQSVGKASVIDLELGRPTKLYGSISQWYFISAIYDKVLHIFCAFVPTGDSSTTTFKSVSECYMKEMLTKCRSHSFDEKTSRNESPTKLFHQTELFHCSEKISSLPLKNEKKAFDLRTALGEVGNINMASQQLVFQVSGTGHGHEIVMSLASLKGSVSRIARGQVDRLGGSLGINCLMLTIAYEGVSRPLLNPWSCNLDVGLAWEPWLMEEASPQVQLTAESDSVLIDLGPEHIRTLQLILSEYKPFLQSFQSNSESDCVKVAPVSADQDQQYRDDLRTGPFQFVDASNGSSQDDLPLPYQVVFWQTPPTMAWRYPQPRALTRVDVFPIPFKVASDIHPGQERKTQVSCSLQYWSECHAHYKPYTQFHLSESEMCRLELPVPPHQVVACTWRVQLTLQSDENDDDSEEETADNSSQILVSPHALSICMKVDSFFSPHKVPRFQAALNFSLIQVALYNHMASSATAKPLPTKLKQFTVDELTPESQFFMSFSLNNSTVDVQMQASGDVSMVEFSSHMRCDVVDYAYLMQHCVIEPFQAKAQLTLGDKKTIRCVTKTIAVRFGPAVGHTLALSADLWAQTFKTFDREITSTPDIENQVIVSRYVICNDLSCPLRFGQASTDEDILLGTRQCHLYSWRSQKMKSLLRIGVEEGAWVWSQPFPIDTDGLQLCDLADCGNKIVRVIVKVTSLSVTQKQVTLSGQLIVSNLLAEHLEFQTVAVTDKLTGQKSEGQVLIAKAKSTPPSVLLDNNCSLSLRVRFHGLSSAWSGDIPLRENTKSGQPWLVKVPLQDRGQFLSVWCHMICQPLGHGEKILAMLCPLYMIRSHLPIPAKVLIDTPGLRVHLEMTVNGRGEEQQLYCPGTIDHSHKLTFQLESGIPPSNPYVPLSYTMIDQRKFFKREDKDSDIDKILESIQEPPKQVWPFVGEEYADVIWNAVGQPETSIQVKYVPQGRHCSTLLVELQPWALLVNMLGQPFALMAEGSIVCRIPHQGIVTPPKLETTFNLALEICDTVHMSPPLQLARLDWGSSFYMPRISGLIPNNGNTQTIILCGTVTSVLNIASVLVDEMRIITVQANYVISNHTSLSLKVSALAIHEYEKCQDFQNEDNQKCVLTLLPFPVDKHTNGCPIVYWNILGEQNGEAEFALYIMLNAGVGWSCPLRVRDGDMRRSFAVPTNTDENGLCNLACTLTMHEHNGQMFLSVYPEPHPQIIVHNMCRFRILCAEENPEHDGIAISENEHLNWWCTIEPNSSSHYSLPSVSKKFPEILSPGSWPRFVLALAEDEGMLVWSRGIIITEVKEQFVHLPGHGDVKVRMQIHCHTVHITVDTVSHVEISARDIRSRLIHHQEDTESVIVEKIYLHPASSPSVPHLSMSSDYLSTSCSSQSHVEIAARTTGSDTSFVSATDSTNTAPPELCTSKTSCDSSSSSMFTVTKITNDIEAESTIASDPLHIHASCFLKGLHITLTDDVPKMSSERTEVVLLSLDNIYVSLKTHKLTDDSEELNVSVSVGDLQLDNQMYQRGGFDFPVILIGQTPKQHAGHGFTLSTPSHLLEEFSVDSLILVRTSIEMLTRKESKFTAMKALNISCGALCTYIEDTLITRLYEFIKCFAPTTSSKHATGFSPALTFVPIPMEVYWNSKQVAYPLRLRTLRIQPVSLLLTAHKSLKLYIALNHSPLQFPAFERCNITTTPYQLGHTLTTHYFFGAIFGAGWMLGSLELLGSPGGFARNLGTGLRDFVRLPYRGIFDGPWGFLVGMTHGSASLMKHVTAGTLSSVTNLAASVARNLDILTLDREHLARTEELRRQRPQGVTQGLLRGLTGLGISLLGAVGGIAHHSLQSMMSEGPSTRGLVTGMGLGLVGAITKPLSGAAELVALTGQGLLHGTGWTTMPEVRQQPIMEHAFSGTNSRLKYGWKLITGFGCGRHTLLHVTDATYVTPAGTYKAVALILTTQALFLVDTEEDVTKRVLSLIELTGIEQSSDPTLLSFHLQTPVETEASFNARVVDYVRHTSGMVVEIGNQSEADESSSLGSPVNSEQDKNSDTLTFYVNPQSRNYFLSVLALAKRQSEGRGFSVL